MSVIEKIEEPRKSGPRSNGRRCSAVVENLCDSAGIYKGSDDEFEFLSGGSNAQFVTSIFLTDVSFDDVEAVLDGRVRMYADAVEFGLFKLKRDDCVIEFPNEETYLMIDDQDNISFSLRSKKDSIA
jgi:hypothetical protein